MKDVLVHPAALVDTTEIGEGTRVWAFTHVMNGARVGRNANIGDHCFIESGATIGHYVTIKNGNMIWDGVVLKDGVFVGPRVCFTNDLYPRSPRLPEAALRYHEKRQWLVPTVVEEGASLGAGSVVIAGVTIGQYALVAAGAVVTQDVPPYGLVRGNPARLKGWVCRCGHPLAFAGPVTRCKVCGQEFVERNCAVERVK